MNINSNIGFYSLSNFDGMKNEFRWLKESSDDVLQPKPACHFHAVKWFFFLTFAFLTQIFIVLGFSPFFLRDNRIEGIISVKCQAHLEMENWKNSFRKTLVICAFAIKFKLGKGKLPHWKSHRFPPEQSWEWNVINNRTILSYNWCEEWNLIALTLSSVSRNKVHYTLSRNSSSMKNHQNTYAILQRKNVCCSSWSVLTNEENVSLSV